MQSADHDSDAIESQDAELERSELQWTPWLRGVMWVNTVLAAISTLWAVYQLSFIGQLFRTAKATGRTWMTPDLAFEIATNLALPALYLYSSVGCLGRKSPARVAMVIYCWCRLAMIAYQVADFVWQIPGTQFEYIAYLAPGLIQMIYEGALLVLTLLFVTRQPIKSLFGHHPTAGFAVLPAEQVRDAKS